MPWIVAILAVGALSVGLLIGYPQWGSTDAVVGAVEKELAERDHQMKHLEKRLAAMEAIFRREPRDRNGAENNTVQLRNPEGNASKDGVRTGTSEPLRPREPRP